MDDRNPTRNVLQFRELVTGIITQLKSVGTDITYNEYRALGDQKPINQIQYDILSRYSVQELCDDFVKWVPWEVQDLLGQDLSDASKREIREILSQLPRVGRMNKHFSVYLDLPKSGTTDAMAAYTGSAGDSKDGFS